LPAGGTFFAATAETGNPAWAVIGGVLLMFAPALVVDYICRLRKLEQAAPDLDARRPRLGEIRRGDGTIEPIMFAETKDPAEFLAVTLEGNPARIQAGDRLLIDVIGPHQVVKIWRCPKGGLSGCRCRKRRAASSSVTARWCTRRRTSGGTWVCRSGRRPNGCGNVAPDSCPVERQKADDDPLAVGAEPAVEPG
jgi:hypothetical protein